MPHSLKFVLALIVMGALAAPVSLIVQRVQTERSKRTTAAYAAHGDPMAGRRAFLTRHCDACHAVDPAVTADGQVGPSLKGLSSRAVIAGRLANTPDNLSAWIAHPQALQPGSAMPDQGLSDQEARDIAAWLLTKG